MEKKHQPQSLTSGRTASSTLVNQSEGGGLLFSKITISGLYLPG